MKFLKLSKFLVLLLLTVAILTGCGNAKEKPTANAAQEHAKVIMLNIGQGDSMLIQAGGKNILVDASKIDTRKDLRGKLKKYSVQQLDLVIATHPHEDHIGGMDAVFNNLPVKEVYDPGAPSSSKLFLNYLNKIKEKKIKFTVPTAGSKYELGSGVYLEFFTPLKPLVGEGANNVSLVFKLTDGKSSMLFTGDIEQPVEAALVSKYGAKLQSDILKAPHHASKTSSSQEFLNAVKAKDVLISCGENNDYKHPHQSVMKRYNEAKMQIYITYEKGDISVSFTAKGYKISTEK